MYFWGGYPALLPWGIPGKEGGIQVLTVLAPSIKNSGILIENSLASLQATKI